LSEQDRATAQNYLARMGSLGERRLVIISNFIGFNCSDFVEFKPGAVRQILMEIRRHCSARGISIGKVRNKAELIALALRPDVQFKFESYLQTSILPTEEAGGGGGPEPGSRPVHPPACRRLCPGCPGQLSSRAPRRLRPPAAPATRAEPSLQLSPSH